MDGTGLSEDGTGLPGSDAGAGAPGGPPKAPGTFGVRILGVSEATRAIRDAVRSDPRLGDLWVEGEISRVTISSAGHAYFALKDERSQLQCVWFRDDRLRSVFEAQTGLRVVAHGRMDLYEPNGGLQLYVESIQPAGVGDLALKFEALKARLAAEGLFESARKRRLPPRPTTIAVITSPTGVVWKDICHVLGRRWPLARVVLVAAQVQGESAPASLLSAFRRLEAHIARLHAEGRAEDAPSVTILARGGGSLEDLWAFNDERVVRAIVAHPLPVVSGVGHESDVTLADFAADVRAPTPSAAAEIVVPNRADYLANLGVARRRLDAVAARRLTEAAGRLAAERRALERTDPVARLAISRERIGLLLDRATRAAASRVAGERARLGRTRVLHEAGARRAAIARSDLATAGAALAVLGPQATLERGYAIVRLAADGSIVREPGEAPGGTRLDLRVARGSFPATSDAP
jgi:exodeoxyribonuclease VII large subunit